MQVDPPPEPERQLLPEQLRLAGRFGSPDGAKVLIGAGVFMLAALAVVWTSFDSGTLPGPDFEAASEMPAELAARYEARFASAHGVPQSVDLSTSGARAEIVAMIPAPQEQAQEIVDAALHGRRPLGRIVVFDSMDEDGDVVRVECGGISAVVTLTKRGTKLAFPYTPGATIDITALKDGGGGGITVVVELAGGPVPLPPMRPGEILRLPLY